MTKKDFINSNVIYFVYFIPYITSLAAAFFSIRCQFV